MPKHWRELRDEAVVVPKPKRIKPLTEGQRQYFEAIANCDIVLTTGPAGSGKSYLAAGVAAGMLADGLIDQIVLTRPMVECGTRIGSLPGDLGDKFGPYVSPLLDAFGDFFTPLELRSHARDETISLQPLELMRGKTFRRSFVIVDEGQNATKTQLLLVLTRIGEGSKVVVNGDGDQTDIREESGLGHALRVLDHPKIGRVFLTENDIVRHGIIRTILRQWSS